MPVEPDHKPRISRGLAAALIAAAIAIVAIVVVAIGVGGSTHSTGTAADPAGVVPASAPLYAGAVVRPEGSLKASAVAAGRALTRTADPYLRLLALLQTPGSPPLDFQRDVAPWLGTNGAIFVSSLESSEANTQLLPLLLQGLLGSSSTASAFPFLTHGVQGAIVLDTSDVDRARSFLESQARRAGARMATYRGVSYQASAGGLAFAIVDRFAVIGSVAGVHGVIDTAFGGPSLAGAPGYAKLLASAPPQTLAHVYANPGAHGASGALDRLAGSGETNVSLVPSASSLALDADSLSSGSASGLGGLLSSASAAGSVQAARELPGESWLAIGLGDVATTLGVDVQGLRVLGSLAKTLGSSGVEAASSSPISLSALLEGILSPLGLLGANTAQAKRDFQSWMGPTGIFASGSGLAELRAGIVIASKNPVLSRAAVAKLAALLRQSGASVQPISISATRAAVSVSLKGLPVSLAIADGRASNGQTKFVIGLGEASVETALNPPSTLAGAPAYTAASAALGEGIQPSITADFPTFLSLIEGVGLSEDPTISRFVPYLRASTTLAGGGKRLGEGLERFRLVLGLRPGG